MLNNLYRRDIVEVADDYEQTKAQRDANKSTVGNKHKFPQQTRRESSSKKKKSTTATEAESEDESDEYILDTLANCCGESILHGGCLCKAFNDYHAANKSNNGADESDWESTIRNKMLEYVHKCRNMGKSSTVCAIGSRMGERDQFIKELVTKTIKEETTTQIKTKQRYTYEFKIHAISGKAGWKNELPVCKNTFLAVYNITRYEFRKCVELMKDNDNSRIGNLRHTVFKDDHLHNYSYAEVADVFAANLFTSTVGMLFLTFLSG